MLNAKLTAEGVLALIISNSEKSVFENNILILGSGRVGKAINMLLNKLNLNITIATFHEEKITETLLMNSKVVYFYSPDFSLEQYDIIINTVPLQILDDNLLKQVQSDAAILEIASVNCLNKEKLNEYAFKYILAPGLPMVYCPKAAADIMFKSIVSL